MALQQYKTLFLVVTVVLSLFVASPAIQRLVAVPQTTTHFTELSIFGSYNNATYPYNITVGQNYRLYLNVTNHLGPAVITLSKPNSVIKHNQHQTASTVPTVICRH